MNQADVGIDQEPASGLKSSRKGMVMYLEIEKVIGREILDSRGNPTVEAEVYLGRRNRRKRYRTKRCIYR